MYVLTEGNSLYIFGFMVSERLFGGIRCSKIQHRYAGRNH